MASDSLEVRIARIVQEAEGIKLFELVDPQGGPLPPFTAGAHVIVQLGAGLDRQYSLANDPQERHRYVIAVLRDPASRGGSIHMHEALVEGQTLRIGPPQNHFPLAAEGTRHLLIAGGIGITPMRAMVHALSRTGADFHLYYCTRSPEMTAFRADLEKSTQPGQVTFVHDGGDPSKGLDAAKLLAEPGEGRHVYVCGPPGLIKGVREAAAHWPSGTVHFEVFSAEATEELHQDGDSGFQVEIASSGQVFEIPADRTILEVLLANDIEVPRLCEEGYCGSCITDVLEGVPDHRDVVLTEDEQASNKLVTVCCSRAKTGRLKLDL